MFGFGGTRFVRDFGTTAGVVIIEKVHALNKIRGTTNIKNHPWLAALVSPRICTNAFETAQTISWYHFSVAQSTHPRD